MHEMPISEQEAEFSDNKWPKYHIYGLTLTSNYPFANRLLPSADDPDLRFTCVMEPPISGGLRQSAPSFASSSCTKDGKSLIYLYQNTNYDVLRFTDIADFYLWPERIVCHLLDQAYDYAVEIYLLGMVLSFWLERQGILVLHTSAIVFQDRVVAFLSNHGGGKSSLAAKLMQIGYPLHTDDLLAVERFHGAFIGRPGYPQMRLWPDQAQHFLGYWQDLEIIHPAYTKRRVPVGHGGFGTFCNNSLPLLCIYIPERRNQKDGSKTIEIVSISPMDTLIEIVRNSFIPHIVEAAGLQPQRLNFLAQIANKVPIRRLVYPSSLENLPLVCDKVLEDLATL